MGRNTSAVRILLVASIGIFMLQGFSEDNTIRIFALWPLQADFMPWQLISYAFLHGNLPHLFFNMYGLWMFGSELENLLGRRTFLRLYFSSVLTAGITQLLVTTLSDNVYPTVGASGGVFGLLLAYGICFPNRMLMLLFPPVPMSARTFVVVYAIIELILGVTGSMQGIAHFAHLGGMVGGYWVISNWLRRYRGY